MFKQKFDPRAAVSALALGASLLATGAQAAGPELVANGGFETGSFSSWATSTTSATSLFGVDDAGPHNGVASAYFGALDPSDTITQTLTTVANTAYTVSFWLDSSLTSGDLAGFVGSFGGTNFISLTDADADFAFKPFSFNVTATSASTVLSFSAYNNNSFYTLDDISVTAAVPEPSTYLLMAVGLAGIGALARRRQA